MYINCTPATATSEGKQGSLSSFYNAVYWYNVLSWSSQSCADVALALGTASALTPLVFAVLPRLRKADRKVAIPGLFRTIAFVGCAGGLSVFAALAFLDIVSTPIRTPGPLVLGSVLGANVKYFGGPPSLSWLETMGRDGFEAFVAATICSFVVLVRDGILAGLGRAVVFFAAPVIIVFETALLIFTPINMTIHATQFLSGTALGDLFTNWYVFVLSSWFLFVGLASKRMATRIGRRGTR